MTFVTQFLVQNPDPEAMKFKKSYEKIYPLKLCCGSGFNDFVDPD
jgi:hypothetical protein